MIPTPLANDFITLYSSPEPQRLFAYSPGIAEQLDVHSTRRDILGQKDRCVKDRFWIAWRQKQGMQY